MAALDPFIRTVLNMMNMFGGDSILVVSSEGAYNPQTSSVSRTETQHAIKTLAFDYIQKHDGESVMSNTLIRSGDKQLYVQPSTFPRPRAKTDSVIYKGIKHSIVTIKEINPSGTSIVLYELFIRE